MWRAIVAAYWAARHAFESERSRQVHERKRRREIAACVAAGSHLWRQEDAAGQGMYWLYRCARCNYFEWFKTGEEPK